MQNLVLFPNHHVLSSQTKARPFHSAAWNGKGPACKTTCPQPIDNNFSTTARRDKILHDCAVDIIISQVFLASHAFSWNSRQWKGRENKTQVRQCMEESSLQQHCIVKFVMLVFFNSCLLNIIFLFDSARVVARQIP